MSYAEKFMTQSGAGLMDGSSLANAWSASQAMLNAIDGERVNFNENISISAGPSNPGLLISLLCFRGFNVTPGDLDGIGLNENGTVKDTDMPTITITSTITTQNFVLWQNCVISGSVVLISDTASDSNYFLNCKVNYTGTTGYAMVGDNTWALMSCEVQTASGQGIDLDSTGIALFCYFRSNHATSSAALFRTTYGTVQFCSFVGNGNTIGVEFLGSSLFTPTMTGGNAFYNCGKDYQFPNSAASSPVFSFMQHMTDSGQGYDCLYAATANWPIFELFNRYRDITTLRTGVSDETLRIGEVDTDTGGPETDYVDAPNGDLRLLTTAAGKDAGLGVSNP